MYSFTIVPIANSSGRQVLEKGDYCMRTNSNKVDINRNWSFDWVNEDLGEDDYSGPKPFSESETKAEKNLIESIKFDIFITIHSGALDIGTPFADSFTNSKNENDKVIKTLSNIAAEINSKYCQCDSGPIADSLGYLSTGNCLDYSFKKLNIENSFAFEIYDENYSNNPFYTNLLNSDSLEGFNFQSASNDSTESNQRKLFLQKSSKKTSSSKSCFNQEQLKKNLDCFKYFNPQTSKQIKNTKIIWTNVLFELLSILSPEKK